VNDPATEIDVLLVGGGVASVRCARTLRRHGFDGSILIVGSEPAAPYNRPPLSKELLREDLDDDLVLAEPLAWYERRRIALRTGTRVERLDPSAGIASLSDGSTVGFERCLIATGAEPIRLRVPGAQHALELRTLADAHRLRDRARAAPAGARVAVIGGGFIGVEVASGLAALGLRPLILEREGALWSGSLGAELDAWGRERLAAAGVEARFGAEATRLEAEAVWVGGERLEAAFAVVGIGVRPRVDVARDAGLAEDGGITTDAMQRTSHPSVWAAGDMARSDGQRVEHWHAAREAGERAALSMLDLPVPPVPPPWFFTEVGGTSLDVIGTAADWDEERWIGDRAVLAHLADGRIARLIIIGSALDPAMARELVAAGATAEGVEEALGDYD
jgi:NADPH-dependent 2,4-dienoyl-CoA reductase/sulfur reductase-like enzyme